MASNSVHDLHLLRCVEFFNFELCLHLGWYRCDVLRRVNELAVVADDLTLVGEWNLAAGEVGVGHLHLSLDFSGYH